MRKGEVLNELGYVSFPIRKRKKNKVKGVL